MKKMIGSSFNLEVEVLEIINQLMMNYIKLYREIPKHPLFSDNMHSMNNNKILAVLQMYIILMNNLNNILSIFI